MYRVFYECNGATITVVSTYEEALNMSCAYSDAGIEADFEEV